MRRGTWRTVVIMGALTAIFLPSAGSTREIQVRDVLRLNCVHPEWATDSLIEETNEGIFEIALMTSPDPGAQVAGTVPCGHMVTIIRIDEKSIADEYEVRAIVNGDPVQGWLWRITVDDHLELERVDH